MTNPEAATSSSPKRKNLLIGAGVAVVAVAALLFFLPGDSAGDAGTQAAQEGMNEEQIRGAQRTGVLTLSEEPLDVAQWDDEWQVTLGPYEAIEFKYTLNEGDAMDFSWSGTDTLHYDLHSHPFEGGTELTESYGIGDAQEMHGRYVAAFTGEHGWYWQNRTMGDVTVTLQASGPMSESKIYDGGPPTTRAVGAE